ncbi:MAG: helicase-related protein, partial [Thermoplasmatales archaeon]
FEWFEDVWKDSKDFKKEFIDFLDNYVTSHSPLEIVAKALYETLKGQIEYASTLSLRKDLLPHQKLSVSSAWNIMEKYGGAIVADPVGLGKTRVGIALASLAMNNGMKPLLIAPKSIIGTTWNSEMDETIGLRIPSINTEMVSSNPEVLKDYNDRNFIIIDEAHYFRSSSSKRFNALVDYLKRKDRKILLLTATPINNSLMDLYNLLTLFVNDDEISDVSPSMKGFFIEQQKRLLNDEEINIGRVVDRFLVRTSRETAQRMSRNTLKFPRRVIEAESYAVSPDPEIIASEIDSLKMPYYDLAIDKQVDSLVLPDGTEVDLLKQEAKKEQLKEMVKTIIKIGYLKRLESSLSALLKSFSRLKDYIEKTVKIAEDENVFVPPKLKSKVNQEGDGYIFNIPDDERTKLEFKEGEREEYIRNALEDIKAIDRLMQIINNMNDKKVETLISKLKSINIAGKNGVIIFTSYSDTAEYLYYTLKKNPQISARLMMVTGNISRGLNRDDRFEILKDFKENGGILISTDVLSAGQNLQNAQYLVNYDFPWNPVVLIQRTGRIDRLMSPYDEIFVTNVIPEKKDVDDPGSLEHFIGLMEKLARKLNGIRQTIGSDVSILGEEPIPKDINNVISVLRGDSELLKEMEEDYVNRLGGLISLQSPTDIYEELKEKLGEERIKKIPYGSGAFKEYKKSGTFVLYRYEQNGNYKFRWILRFDDGEVITDTSKILEILLSEPNDNKGKMINYSLLKEGFDKVKESFLELSEREGKKTVRGMPRELREILDYINKNPLLLPYVPLLRDEEGDLNLMKSLKKALKDGRLEDALKEKFGEGLPSPPIKDSENSANEITNLHRVVWCVLDSSMHDNFGLAVQHVFPLSNESNDS